MAEFDMVRLSASIQYSRLLEGYGSPLAEEANRFLEQSGLVAAAMLPLSKLNQEEFIQVVDEIQTKLLS